jgi:hypothetical protein
MKYQKTLSSFLLLALIITCSSQAYASEVTGTLSAGSNTNTSGGGGTSSGSGAISGSVGGGTSGGTSSSGNGSSGGNGGGSVLGASTGPSSSNVSSDGTALEPNRSLAIDYGTGTSSTDTTPPQTLGETSTDYSSANTAAAVGGIGGFSPMTWFWIILLALLLIGTIIYIYNRSKEDNRRARPN